MEDIVVGVKVGHLQADEVVLFVDLDVADREIGGSSAGIVRFREVEVPPVDVARVEARPV